MYFLEKIKNIFPFAIWEEIRTLAHMNIFSFVLDIFSKQTTPKQEFLAKYLETLEPYPSICHITKRATSHFDVLKKTPECSLDKVIVGFYYREEIISQAIQNAKFYGQYQILHDFAPYLSTLLLENIPQKKEEVILASVPMHFWKQFKRGYNQSEILAKSIAQYSGLEYLPIAKKIRLHDPQSHLKKIDRLKNIAHSFTLKKQYIPLLNGKTVVLVDDVVSTGATLSEIANLLRKSGVKKVYGLCIASN